MYNIPVINLPDESDEESGETEDAVNQTLDEEEDDDDDEDAMYPQTDRDSSTATDEDQKMDDKRNDPKGEQIKNSLKNISERIAHQHRRLLNKHQMLLAERRATLENISRLHDKLLNVWNDKMKSEHEYGYQYLRSIESSQAVWQCKLTIDSSKRSDLTCSNGRTVDETSAEKHERSKKQNVERLDRDLLESTEKRIKTLEEVASLIRKELDEAKKECGLLDKDLAETVIHLEEKEQVLKMLNENEENKMAGGKFLLRGMPIQSDRNKAIRRSHPQPYTYKSEREVAEFVVEKRSTAVYPTYSNNSEINSDQKEISSITTTNRRSSYRTTSRSFPAEQSFYGNNASSRSSEAESTDNNPATPTYGYSYFYTTTGGPSSSSTAISLSRTSEAPRKRGRPRKRPETVRVPAVLSEPAKKKRGRPRKYLKLELTRIPSTV